MYVCLCHGVSDKTLTELIKGGKSLKDIRALTKAGTTCGACLPSIKTLVKRKDNERKS